MTTPAPILGMFITMKTIILSAALLLANASTQAIADDLIEKKLQQALFAEEGARDLDQAIEAYHAVIAAYDTQRKFAATAMFRLAECHRKRDENGAAVAAYQRLLREFPEEETLARLASENLATLGAGAAEGADPEPATLATEAAEIERIKNLVALSPDLMNDPESALLHKAAAKSQLQVAKFLLDSGADINLRGGDRLPAETGFNAPVATPVSVAASSGHLAMVKLLLDRGAEVDDFTIYSAGFRKRAAVMDLLLDHLPESPEAQFHALRAACHFGRPDFVAKLVEAGAPLTSSFGNWSPPLQLAVEQGNLPSIEILLAGGATPDEEIILLAIQAGAEIFQPIWDTGMRSPNALRVALEQAVDPEISKAIIAGTNDIAQVDAVGATALGLASYYLKPELVRAALEKGADPDRHLSLGPNRMEGITPLIAALNSNALTGSAEDYERSLNEVVDLLIAAGADIDARNRDGYPALLYARSPDGAGRATPLSTVNRILAQNPECFGIGENNSELLFSPHSTDPGLKRIAYYCASKLPGRPDHLWFTASTSLQQLPPQPTKLSEIVFQNPQIFELEAIPIIRAGEDEPVMIDYAEIIASGDTGRDLTLGAGDVVLGTGTADASTPALSPEQLAFLTAAASKQVTVRRGEHQWRGTARPGERPPHVYDPGLRIAYAKTVKSLLDAIYATTYDPSRIEVKHSDGEVTMFNYLIASTSPQDDLNLRDGDEITLTPVESSDLGYTEIALSREADLFQRRFDIGENPYQIDLAEFIAAVYSDSSSVLPSPDLAKITIKRQSESLHPDLEQVFVGPLIQLQPGDIVEIPALAEADPGWQQLDDAIIEKLQASLGRSASFLLSGSPAREVRVGPQFFRFPISDGLRTLEPLATPGDASFEVLGLATESAVRALGYQPSDQLSIGFAQGAELENNRTPFRELDSDPNAPIYPFPIIRAGDTIQIGIGQKQPFPSLRSAPPSSSPPQTPAAPNPRPSGRRVVLPPKGR